MPVAVVDTDECGGCGLCKDICPYEGAVSLKNWKSEIKGTECEGCAVCVGSCPSLALNLKHLPRERILARIKAFTKRMRAGEENPKLLIMICDWLSRKGASISDARALQYAGNVLATKVPCIGAFDPIFAFNALLSGVDGFLVVGCGVDDCDNLEASGEAKPRVKYAKKYLDSIDIEPKRLRFELLPLDEAKQEFVRVVKDTLTFLKDLDPNPL